MPGGVQAARLAGVGFVLAEYLRPEGDRSGHRLGVGVEQQLGRIAAQAAGRIPGPADPVPVGLARADAGHERMPDVGVVIQYRDLGFRARRVEQAQRDTARDAGADREVRARNTQMLTGRSAKRERAARERCRALGRRRAGRRRSAAGRGGRRGTWWCHDCGLLRNGTDHIADGADRAVAAADHVRDQPGPSGLVRGAEPGAVVAVEVLVEQQVVFPGRVVLHLVDPAEAGPPPVRADGEQGDEPVLQVGGDHVERHLVPEPAGYSMVSSSPKNR